MKLKYYFPLIPILMYNFITLRKKYINSKRKRNKSWKYYE